MRKHKGQKVSHLRPIDVPIHLSFLPSSRERKGKRRENKERLNAMNTNGSPTVCSKHLGCKYTKPTLEWRGKGGMFEWMWVCSFLFLVYEAQTVPWCFPPSPPFKEWVHMHELVSFLHLSQSLSVSLSLSLPVSLSFSLSVCLSVSQCVSVCLSVSQSLSFLQSVYAWTGGVS